MRAYVRTCVRTCVRAYVRAYVRARARARVCACMGSVLALCVYERTAQHCWQAWSLTQENYLPGTLPQDTWCTVQALLTSMISHTAAMEFNARSLALMVLILVARHFESVECTDNPGNTQPGRNRSRVQSMPLFPLRKSWCKATEIEQVVQVNGCDAQRVKNKACVGQCYSYHLPGTLPRDNIPEESLRYCDWCRPSLKTWRKVSLKCPRLRSPQVDKLVEIILECACQKCSGNDGS